LRGISKTSGSLSTPHGFGLISTGGEINPPMIKVDSLGRTRAARRIASRQGSLLLGSMSMMRNAQDF